MKKVLRLDKLSVDCKSEVMVCGNTLNENTPIYRGARRSVDIYYLSDDCGSKFILVCQICTAGLKLFFTVDKHTAMQALLHSGQIGNTALEPETLITHSEAPIRNAMMNTKIMIPKITE